MRAVVEDCGYTSAWDEFSYQMDALFGLQPFPLINYSSLVTRVRAGYWLEDVSALKQVKKSVTPTFFIRGGDDAFVPAEMVYTLYEACGAEKELMVVEGAGHAGASSVSGEAYWERVWAFLANYVA